MPGQSAGMSTAGIRNRPTPAAMDRLKPVTTYAPSARQPGVLAGAAVIRPRRHAAGDGVLDPDEAAAVAARAGLLEHARRLAGQRFERAQLVGRTLVTAAPIRADCRQRMRRRAD